MLVIRASLGGIAGMRAGLDAGLGVVPGAGLAAVLIGNRNGL